MNSELPTDINGQIVTHIKPALMDRSVIRLLPAGETVASAVEAVKSAPNGPYEVEVAAQLHREMAGKFSYLAVKPGGMPKSVVGTTKLSDITMVKEVRTPRGLEQVLAAAVYVQSYMPVGG